MKSRLILVSGAVLLLAACESTSTTGPAPAPRPAAPSRPAAQAPAPTPAPMPGSAFNAGDFAWSTKAGKGQIAGQVTYRAAGKTFVCSEQGVVLSPETPWVRRRMEILYLSAEHATLPLGEVRARTPPERNPAYDQFVKRGTCDATGKFSFTGLADGNWYVISVIRPPAGAGPAPPAGDMAVMRHVVIKNGAVARVNL
jgi:hypothetical protein